MDLERLQQLVESCSRKLHSDDSIGCAAEIADAFKVPFRIPPNADPVLAIPTLQTFQKTLLDHRLLFHAARMAWPIELFDYRPKYTQDIFRLLTTRTQVLLQGAASCSKSYTAAVWMLLEWWADPDWTTIKAVGPSGGHLEENLFSHMVALHQSSRIPIPGECGDLFIGKNRRNQLGSIKGVLIPIGKNKKAGRVQGTKRKPRSTGPHPLYGMMSRLIIFLEEAERIPGGIWGDIGNTLSNLDVAQPFALRIVGAYNPEDVTSPVAARAEPKQGWKNFNVDEDHEWVSKRGWTVLRLDGEQSENVKEGRQIYLGIQTREGLEAIAKNAGGRNAPGYLTMGRGSYPILGAASSVVKPGRIAASTGTPIWQGTPEKASGTDAALDGGAGCPMTYGFFGPAVGVSFPKSKRYPNGARVMFKDPKTGRIVPRICAQVVGQTYIPKGDSVEVASSVRARAIERAIKGEYSCMDSTGIGAGVAHILKHANWPVIPVNYSENPTEIPLISGGKSPLEEFSRVCCELYFAVDTWMEYGCLYFSPDMNTDLIEVQFTDRRFRLSGVKRRVEAKSDYKERHEGHSPDEADSVSLFLHAVRLATRFSPSPTGEGSTLSMPEGSKTNVGDEEWPAALEETDHAGIARLDPTAMIDDLD